MLFYYIFENENMFSNNRTALATTLSNLSLYKCRILNDVLFHDISEFLSATF